MGISTSRLNNPIHSTKQTALFQKVNIFLKLEP